MRELELEHVPDVYYGGWENNTHQWKCCAINTGPDANDNKCNYAHNDPFAAPLVTDLVTYAIAGTPTRAASTPSVNASVINSIESNSHNGGFNSGGKIGVGVGIGVGIPVLMFVALSAIFLMRRKIVKQARQTPPQHVVEKIIVQECPIHGSAESDISPPELYSNSTEHELAANAH